MFARSHQDIARTDSGFETCLGSFNQVAIAPQWRLTRKIRLQFRNGKLGDNASFAKKQVTACSASTLVDAILPYHCATPQSIGQRHPACQSRLIQSTTSNTILAAPHAHRRAEFTEATWVHPLDGTCNPQHPNHLCASVDYRQRSNPLRDISVAV